MSEPNEQSELSTETLAYLAEKVELNLLDPTIKLLLSREEYERRIQGEARRQMNHEVEHILRLSCAKLAARINDRVAEIQKLRAENDQLSAELRQSTAWLRAA